MCQIYSKQVKELALKNPIATLKQNYSLVEYNLKIMQHVGNYNQVKNLLKEKESIKKAIQFQQTKRFRRCLQKIKNS